MFVSSLQHLHLMQYQIESRLCFGVYLCQVFMACYHTVLQLCVRGILDRYTQVYYLLIVGYQLGIFFYILILLRHRYAGVVYKGLFLYVEIILIEAVDMLVVFPGIQRGQAPVELDTGDPERAEIIAHRVECRPAVLTIKVGADNRH